VLDLTGRSAVVTGAGSGIGRASAEVLASAGATVVCADIDLGSARDTASRIEKSGGSATATRVEVSDRSQVESLVSSTVEDHGRLDVMCNIAGIISMGSVVDVDEAELDRVLAVNFKGVFFGCQAAARQMARQGSGSIINMASGAVDVAGPNLVSYSCAKAAVVQLTKILAMEMGSDQVRVNAVAPGFVLTGMTGRHFVRPDGSIDEAAREATITPMRESAPLKMIGEPEDIAWAVLYLASDAARFVTGQILRPNGGIAMPW
jgi:3-oxoacyl-[acyl-carrier protein] reductase